MAIQLIDEAVQAGARYAQACEVLGLSCRTLRRWHQDTDDLQDKRGRVKRIPSHALTDWEKRRILEVANQPAYKSLPPSQIVPKLADRDIYIASESSFYRVLKEHGQNNHRGKAQPVRKVPKPAPVVARAPNTAWSWDITFLPTQIRGQFLRLYMMIDVYSRNIVGWEIHEDERSEHAARLMEKACLKHQIKPDQLILHSDNGSPMKGATMLATLQRLGVVPSFSRPSVSDDNPFSEALFRTLKYTPSYPSKPFTDIEQARQWVHRFVTWYNEEHCHSGIRFVTPAQRHHQLDTAVLMNRHKVYEAAKQRMPERWRNRSTRNWTPIQEVWLNPSSEQPENTEKLKVAA